MSSLSRRSVLLLGVVLAAAAVSSACDRRSPAPGGPSADPTSPASPSPATASEFRIVALSPAIAATLRDLGLGSLIVGRHGYDAWTDPAVPVCGDQAGIDYEALIRAEPTHVLLEWGTRDVPDRLRQLADRYGWTIENYTLLSLDEVARMAEDLHRLFAARPAAVQAGTATDAGPDGETQRDKAMPAHPPLPPRLAGDWFTQRGDLARVGRVLMLVSVSPPAALGPGSFHHQILEAIGGTPALTVGAPYITMDAEDVLRLQPDAIVLFSPRAIGAPVRTGPIEPAEYAAALGALASLEIPAIRNRRVGVIDDPLALIPSTHLVTVGDDLAALLQGWAATERRGREDDDR